MRIKPAGLALLVLAVLLTGCMPAEQGMDTEAAAQALSDFFRYLNSGQYARADMLYGGSYEALTAMNPDVDPDDHAALWQRACTVNGLQCLPVETLTPSTLSGSGFTFKVTFTAADNSTFVLGPCCGATETEMPPVSMFDYHVVFMNGEYRVVDLPVFVP